MSNITRVTGFVLTLVLSLSGCTGSVSGPEKPIEFDLVAEPATVLPGDTFSITVTVRNPNDRVVHTTSGCGGVLFTVDVSQEGIQLTGTITSPCLAVVTDVDIGPGEKVYRYDTTLIQNTGEPAPPGAYTLLAWPMIGEQTGSVTAGVVVSPR